MRSKEEITGRLEIERRNYYLSSRGYDRNADADIYFVLMHPCHFNKFRSEMKYPDELQVNSIGQYRWQNFYIVRTTDIPEDELRIFPDNSYVKTIPISKSNSNILS